MRFLQGRGFSSLRHGESGRSLTRRQLRAVVAAMRLLVEEDVARGVPDTHDAWCAVCQHMRPARGSVGYGHLRLCNRCAIRYEVSLMTGRWGETRRLVLAPATVPK